MKLLNINLSPEVKQAIGNRRRKILFAIYLLSIFMFSVPILFDLYYLNYNIIFIRITALIFTLFFFFTLFMKKNDEQAAHMILLVIALATIFSIFISKFNNFTPIYIVPFIIGTFSLFSWKKGAIINFLFLFMLILIAFICRDYLIESKFLQNNMAVLNFLIVIFLLYIFTYFYESTRVESYKILLQSNYKKDLLYNEIHHRVKNNLNIVSSMLAIQADYENEKIQNIIHVSKERIDSIAMVHSMLYVTNDIEKVNAEKFIKKLSYHLLNTYNEDVNVIIKIKQIELSLNEVIPIGLILNELLTNSFKYAFKTKENPKIIIVLKLHKNNVMLTYHDNGCGYEKNYQQNIGLKLVDLNTRQLKGNQRVKSENGLTYKIIYKRRVHV